MLRRKSLLDILSTGDGPRLAIAALLFWTTAIEPAIAQTSPPPAQQTPSSGAEQAAPHYSMEDLSYLLEPIALYPDPLLALILSASTFPVQIVEAEQWIAFNPISVRRGDFSEVDAMDWDSSVKALTRFPEVIRKLADHLDWTESLGIAVATQTSDVTAAIQLLRAKAETLGNLQSTPEQTVTTRDEGARESSTCCPPIPKGFTCQSTIQRSYSVVLLPELLHSVSACWLAQPGIAAGAGTIADGIKSGSLRQRGIPRLPLGGRRIAQGAGHRDPGDRIARAAIDLNAPAAGRNVLADLVVVPKFRVFGRSVLVDPRARTLGRSVLVGPAVVPKLRTFGRSVLAGPVVVPKLRMFGRSVLAADPKARTFGRSVLVVLVRVPKSQAFGLNGLRLVPRLQVVQRVLVVHNDPATRLAPAAGIVTSLVRVRINRRDNNPAM